MLGMRFGGFFGVMLGVRGVARRHLRVVRGRLDCACLVMLRGFVMMLGGLFVMLGGLGVMFCSLCCRGGHVTFPSCFGYLA
jgi:hypothetical protein